MDRSNLLERFLDLLRQHEVPFCLIDGQALNAYVKPVVSLDLDIADIARILEAFPHLGDLVPAEIRTRLIS